MPLARPSRRACRALFFACACLIPAGAGRADAPPVTPAGPPPEAGAHRRWHDTASLGVVATSGNTENTNVTFDNTLAVEWPETRLILATRMLRVDTTRRDIHADFADPANPRVVVERSRARTSEEFDVSLKVERTVHKRLGWFAFTEWEQNRPAGLSSRSRAGAGLSWTIPEGSPLGNLRVEAGLDGTRESPVQGDTRTYAGARLATGWDRKLGSHASLRAGLEFLENLEDTHDLRVNGNVGLEVAITSKLALKTSWEVRYDREPQRKLFANPAGGPPAVFVYDTTDTVFSTSLLVQF